ncbi:hypothetical protein MHA01_00810 [Marinococcus halophilus]|uniref:Uncharacterized protein n=1 Tax=Marinococcus halophilus TaxID=1371 RepID=A0A510Y1J2_MARHA|nr:hypothetical protein [Marinococcus halophilus]GEK57176.1 hypothetical protein MHA01_00810 [Marinococcus halophilus]
MKLLNTTDYVIIAFWVFVLFLIDFGDMTFIDYFVIIAGVIYFAALAARIFLKRGD